MKNLFRTLLLAAVVLTAGTLASCKDKEENTNRYEGIPTISVSPADLAVTLTGGTTEAVTITTEAEWTVSIPSDASDITVSKTSGFGNGSITFTVPAHAERNVAVTVTATGYYNNQPLTKSATINIAQNESGESLEGTIASITEAGSYTINNAVVVGTYDSGFVMTDRSKLYFLVYMFDKTSNPNPQVPAVGSVVNVSGEVVDHNGMLQFNYTATVTPTGETQQVDLGEPAAYGYEEMKAYKSNPSYVYVKYTGTLSVNKTYYNVLFAEGTDTQGSISYPNPELNVASYNGKVIDVTGFLVGTSGSSYVNTCCTAISENTSTPSISATAPSTFAAAGETLNVTYTTQNLGSNQIFAEVTGEGFSAGTPANGTVAVTAAANNESVAKSGTLTLYIAASEGGEHLAEAVVALKQAPYTEAGASYQPVTSAPADWSGQYVVGYVDGETCYIIDAKKNGDSATQSYFTYKLLTSSEFDGTNIAYNEAYNTITLAKVSGSDYYSMQYGSMYVGWTSSTGNSCEFTTTAPTSSTTDYLWTVEFNEDNLIYMTVVSMKDDAKPRRLQFNSNNNQERFAIYANSQKNLTLYTLK